MSAQDSEEGASTLQKQTVVHLSVRSDGTWEATQNGLDIVGTGPSAPRATEDMARQIAEQQEDGDQ